MDGVAMNEELQEAAAYGQVAVLRRLLGSNPELVRETDEYQFTALHHAVGDDSTEAVALLLKTGADPNAQNDSGHAALHLVAYPGHVDLLVAHGADINLQSNGGSTPLVTHAAEQDRVQVMQRLLELGADASIASNSGTALSIAQRRQERDKVSLLTQYLSES